jgi:predicted dehydrogenase
MYSPKLDSTEALQREAQHFIDCIENGTKPETDGAAGLRVVKILEAATESLKLRGGVVELD